MEKVVLGRVLVFMVRFIGAWPGYKNVYIRTFTWLFMLVTIVCQLMYILDYAQHDLNALMEVVAVIVTNILSLVKIFSLWYSRRHIEQCVGMMREDWESITDNRYLALMSRHSKIARQAFICVMVSYYVAAFVFIIRTLLPYSLGTSNYENREYIVNAKYPFDANRSPIYEIILGIGIGQIMMLCSGNFLADSLLITMIAHVSGQLAILHDRLLRFSEVEELSRIIQKHQEIIHFAENMEITFKWIGLTEFLSGSVIICAIGFVIVTTYLAMLALEMMWLLSSCSIALSLSSGMGLAGTARSRSNIISACPGENICQKICRRLRRFTLESDLDSGTMIKFGTYIVAMTLGVFIYGCAGNILIEKSISISDAAYGSCWTDLPPQTSKILIMIMMRADRPLYITAGKFLTMNYESFVNIMKTAASYLSVIRAGSE